MKMFLKKYIKLLLIFVLLLTSVFFVSTSVLADEGDEEILYENLTDYMEKNGWYGTSTEYKEKDEITQMWIFGYGNTTIKDLSDIKELTNLEELVIYGTTLQGNISFSSNTKLKTIRIYEEHRYSATTDEIGIGDLSNVIFDFRRNGLAK